MEDSKSQDNDIVSTKPENGSSEKQYGSEIECDREVESFGRTISIKQDFSGELGGTVWDAALVLAKYFENTTVFPPGYFKGKRILELGSGTGLIGIVLALLGANVIVTDQQPLLKLMNHNILRNEIEKRATAEVLNWGEEDQHVNSPFDVIVACDVIANCYSETYDKFLKTLASTSNKNTLIIMAYEKRDQRELEFFKKLKVNFTYKKVPNSELDSHWQSDDIGIFRITKSS